MEPLSQFASNRSFPEIAMPVGVPNLEISDAFTVAPEVVYSPMVPFPKFPTNTFWALRMPAGLHASTKATPYVIILVFMLGYAQYPTANLRVSSIPLCLYWKMHLQAS
jgi:hypothetical protein